MEVTYAQVSLSGDISPFLLSWSIVVWLCSAIRTTSKSVVEITNSYQQCFPIIHSITLGASQTT